MMRDTAVYTVCLKVLDGTDIMREYIIETAILIIHQIYKSRVLDECQIFTVIEMCKVYLNLKRVCLR
jgi:hypothetical protein